MDMTFAKKIRSLRQKKDWSVYDLADKIGKTPGYISKIEARGEIPSPDMIVTLGQALGINPGELAEIAKREKTAELKESVNRKYDEAISLYRKSKEKR